MTPEEWLKYIPSVARRVGRGTRWLVLRSSHGVEDITLAETTLQHDLPPLIKTALLGNGGASAQALLETFARLLNPTKQPAQLMPTGQPNERLFSALVDVLKEAKEWAIFLDVQAFSRSFIGGVRPVSPSSPSRPRSEYTRSWACYVPISFNELLEWGQQFRIPLSPQMRQFYTFVGGALDEYTWPSVYGLDRLRRGDLYEGLYRNLQQQLLLPEEKVQRLQDFVVLSDSVTGDSAGFFPSSQGELLPEREENPIKEYPIYEWVAESAEFSPLANTFSEFIELLLSGEW